MSLNPDPGPSPSPNPNPNPGPNPDQFCIWGRQFALTLLTFVPDVADELCLSKAANLRCPKGKLSARALDIVVLVHALLAALVLAVAWLQHQRRKPYKYDFQNWLEAWLLFVGIAVVLLGVVYTFVEQQHALVEALLLVALIGNPNQP